MYVCFNCDYKTETQSKFCPHCGQPMAIVQREKPVTTHMPERPAPVRPTYTPPTYTYVPPTYYYPTPARPEPCEVPIGKKIVGMVLAIVGMVMAFAGFFVTAMEMDYRYGEPFTYAFAYSILSFPGSIVGLNLSNQNREDGDTSGFSMVGRVMGIIGIALMAFTMFLGFVAQID